MKRRATLAALGGIAAGLTLSARTQNASMPIVGVLSIASPDLFEERMRAFRRALKDAGYIEGQNVEIDYRWTEGVNKRLPTLATELVRRKVSVIVAVGGTPSALAAKAASTTIPIVFGVAADPIKNGLVASLNHPGGNLTGVINLNLETIPKRLELLQELLPKAKVFALLVDPTNNSDLTDASVLSVQEAAKTLGLQLHVLYASTERDFETTFTTLARIRAGGLIIGPFIFFTARTEQLAALTVRYALPAISNYRPFVAAGGLLSYGSNETEYFELIGTYTARILRGEKPSDLPVQQARKVELFINLKTAKALGITIPASLLARADEVIQ